MAHSYFPEEPGIGTAQDEAIFKVPAKFAPEKNFRPGRVRPKSYEKVRTRPARCTQVRTGTGFRASPGQPGPVLYAVVRLEEHTVQVSNYIDLNC